MNVEKNPVIRLVDVAEAAGVSRGTASNVFNNPELVRPKLRQKVQAAVRELGYLGPDPKGRLLRAGKFNAIGVMPPSEARRKLVSKPCVTPGLPASHYTTRRVSQSV